MYDEIVDFTGVPMSRAPTSKTFKCRNFLVQAEAAERTLMTTDNIIGIMEKEIEKGGHPRNIAINIFELVEPLFIARVHNSDITKQQPIPAHLQGPEYP